MQTGVPKGCVSIPTKSPVPLNLSFQASGKLAGTKLARDPAELLNLKTSATLDEAEAEHAANPGSSL